MVIGAILRPAIFKLGKYVYQGLRQQDKLIDFTYRKSGLYNRGVVRGIKHGLIAGQIIGGTLQLGLNAPDTPGNDVVPPYTKRPKFTPGKSFKTRNRYPSRCYPRSKVRFRPNQSRR